MSQRHTIAILVNDAPGVLQRVSSLFGRRGFNIDSITVGASEEPGLSRMIIVTLGDESIMHQVTNQLEKLVDVVNVDTLSERPMVTRELALIKVSALPVKRSEILALADTFRATVVDVASTSMVLQVVGEKDIIDNIIELLKPYGIVQLCRTGATAISRGNPDNDLVPSLDGP